MSDPTVARGPGATKEAAASKSGVGEESPERVEDESREEGALPGGKERVEGAHLSCHAVASSPSWNAATTL
jgi:hypothetical protein